MNATIIFGDSINNADPQDLLEEVEFTALPRVGDTMRIEKREAVVTRVEWVYYPADETLSEPGWWVNIFLLSDDTLALKLSKLPFSVRLRNAFDSIGLRTLGELSRLSLAQVHMIRNVGETSRQEIIDMLACHGLKLASPPRATL